MTKFKDLEITYGREREGTIDFYKDSRGEFRWRIIAPNGNNVANSGEGYKNKQDCINGLASAKWHIDNSEVEQNW